MAEEFDIAGIRLGGGLNLVDSPEDMDERASRILKNFRRTGSGRQSTRRAARSLTNTITGEPIGIFPYTHWTSVGAVLLTWDSGGSVVKLYNLNTSGGGATFIANLPGWTSVSAKPRVSAALLNRVLFICDEGKSYGLTCYDPNNVLASHGGAAANDSTALFRPKFIFDSGTAAVMKCRLVAELNNVLLTFGYGAETTGSPDRPEFMHWSYVGLDPDSAGAGDAGDGGTAGSAGIFDLEDASMVGARGIPVVSVTSASGRAVIATADRAFVMYGSDRDSFELDELDAARGSPTTRGMVSNGSNVFWLTSLLDIARYDGGKQITVLSEKVAPRIAEMNLTTMFAAHAPDEHQVRWYYALLSDSNTTPDRFLAWDYIDNGFREDTLGYRAFCAGYVKQSGSESPAAAPTNAAASNLTSASASVNWANGDTSPGVTTEVQYDTAIGFGTAVSVTGILSGVATYGLTGLLASTLYYTRERHWRNGNASAWSTILNFTTLAAGAVAAPLNFAAANAPIWNEKYHRYDPNVLLTWDPPTSGLHYEIYRSTVNGFTPGPTNLLTTTLADVTSYSDTAVTNATTYYYKARSVDAAGTTSSYTSQVSILVSIAPA